MTSLFSTPGFRSVHAPRFEGWGRKRRDAGGKPPEDATLQAAYDQFGADASAAPAAADKKTQKIAHKLEKRNRRLAGNIRGFLEHPNQESISYWERASYWLDRQFDALRDDTLKSKLIASALETFEPGDTAFNTACRHIGDISDEAQCARLVKLAVERRIQEAIQLDDAAYSLKTPELVRDVMDTALTLAADRPNAAICRIALIMGFGLPQEDTPENRQADDARKLAIIHATMRYGGRFAADLKRDAVKLIARIDDLKTRLATLSETILIAAAYTNEDDYYKVKHALVDVIQTVDDPDTRGKLLKEAAQYNMSADIQPVKGARPRFD